MKVELVIKVGSAPYKNRFAADEWVCVCVRGEVAKEKEPKR